MKPTVWVKIFAPGLGDLVVLGPVLYNLKDRNIVDKINLIVFNEGQRQLASRMWWINDTYLDTETVAMVKTDFYIDMSEHPLEKVWWGSDEHIDQFGKVHAMEMMNQIIGGMGIPDKLPPLKAVDTMTYNREVYLAPGGRRKTKLLPTRIWLDIAEALIHKGYKVRTIGSRGHTGSEQIGELESLGIEHLHTPTVAHLIDWVNISSGVISIDNGLYHISSYLNKPTVGIFGVMPSWLWGGLGKNTVNLEKQFDINFTTVPLDWEFVGGKNPVMDNYQADEIIYMFERAVGISE